MYSDDSGYQSVVWPWAQGLIVRKDHEKGSNNDNDKVEDKREVGIDRY